jgi:ADP-ribosylglycohydrolase
MGARAEVIALSRKEYRDKVHACWLGKNIGGTLGAPYECQQTVNHLTYYDPVPARAAPNDDLDLQLVWLKLLEDVSTDPPLPAFADYWIRFLSAYPWNEYGFCRRNLERGLRPPISGCFENYYVDEMGSPIRSEIWACVAPGDPQLAASMAWKDSVLDHAGGEGMYGEMFWAAVESAAFVVHDPMTLIRIGLAMIPIPCAISRVIREAVWCRENKVRWAEARERIVRHFQFGHRQPCHAVVNHGFIILGWLYGGDFGDGLCKAVNCGFDTDCTGATLGSLLGILGGTAGIPRKWSEPLGQEIVLHKFTGPCDAPKDIAELTERTARLAKRVLAERSDAVRLGHATGLSPDPLSALFRNDRARLALQRDILSAVAVDGDLEITLHYNGDPVLYPGIARRFEVSFARDDQPVKARASLSGPKGWAIEREQGNRFVVRAAAVADRNVLAVTARERKREARASFTVLGPGEAKGFPAGEIVPTCRRCGARKEACICRGGK